MNNYLCWKEMIIEYWKFNVEHKKKIFFFADKPVSFCLDWRLCSLKENAHLSWENEFGEMTKETYAQKSSTVSNAAIFLKFEAQSFALSFLKNQIAQQFSSGCFITGSMAISPSGCSFWKRYYFSNVTHAYVAKDMPALQNVF